ncbi:hypothetical protein EWI31_07240 [Streptomyces tsukubensis]|nr:hypothetical protein EWI31_07240 [Streptomyces tsukubensis]
MTVHLGCGKGDAPRPFGGGRSGGLRSADAAGPTGPGRAAPSAAQHHAPEYGGRPGGRGQCPPRGRGLPCRGCRGATAGRPGGGPGTGDRGGRPDGLFELPLRRGVSREGDRGAYLRGLGRLGARAQGEPHQREERHYGQQPSPDGGTAGTAVRGDRRLVHGARPPGHASSPRNPPRHGSSPSGSPLPGDAD